MGKLQAFLIFAFTVIFSAHAQSAERILQILHVNDVHSFWQTNEEDGGGGLARIKTILDKLEAEGTRKGWVTIKLDAGDFSDGHINFLNDRGTTTFKIEHALNFDAVALGNHDYMTGLDDLMGRFADSEQRIPFVAANFDTFRNVGVRPGIVINRGGLKIAVGGATLKSRIYNWFAWPAHFSSPRHPLDDWLANNPADIHIALTHIGFDQDKILAEKSSHIDVVIGGHSHTVVDTPVGVYNKNYHLVPVVQAGSHGSYVGQMVLRISDITAPDIIDYHLIKVDGKTKPNVEIEKLITEGRRSLQKQLNTDLTKVIANAEQNYPSQLGRTPLLGNFLADAIRESSASEIALDSGELYGEGLRKGPLTIGDIFGLEPHTYSWANGGWHIFTCDAYALSIEWALAWLSSSSHSSLVVSGMELSIDQFRLPRDVQVHGEPIDYSRVYKTAFSEGFIEALAGRPQLAKMLCKNMTDTGFLIRDALVQKATKVKVFSDKNLGDPRVHFWTK